MGKCLGHFALSRYLAHDLPAEEQQQVSSHLGECERCRSLLHEIEQDRAAYSELGQAPYNAAWQRAVSSGAGQPRPARRWPGLFRPVVWKILLPVAAACVVAVLLVPRLASPPSTRYQAYRGYKGNLSLQIIAKRGERQFIVSAGERLCPGDALRFSITTEGPKSYLAIFSVDQTSTLSAFYPNETTPRRLLEGSGRTVELTGQGRHLLPGSIVLDRSQGREVIFMLAAPGPFDPRPLEARIRKIAGENPGAAPLLSSERIGFSGTTRAVVIVKVPCS